MVDESRLVKTFLDLVAIDSSSGNEEVISKELGEWFQALGGDVHRDHHGNIVARWDAAQGEWLMLSAHMDTVGTDTGIRPQVRDGVIYSDGSTILGADDKSGLAVIIEVIRSLREGGTVHPPLEVVVTVSEEVGLRGAKLLEKGQLRSRRGYVLDAGGPIGTIVTSAPSQDSLQVTVRGRSAHAGSEPERGVNAIKVASEAIASMPLGRIDHETTANIGVIEGGTATNIVPDLVRIRGEARSRDNAKLAEQTATMAQAFTEAAERYAAQVEFKINRAYNTYALAEDHPVVARAIAAAGKLGFVPTIKASGGGTDANIYAEEGIACAILSTGMEEVHTPQEHIAIADMGHSARLLLEIIVPS